MAQWLRAMAVLGKVLHSVASAQWAARNYL